MGPPQREGKIVCTNLHGRPWADSPRETAGARISQSVISLTTDSIRGDVSEVARQWGTPYFCGLCGAVYRSWVAEAGNPLDWRCVACMGPGRH